MNVFFLDIRPSVAAEYHCDKHVIKMILESAQLLCTAHRLLDQVDPQMDTVLYRATHANHPCAIWTRQSTQSYYWLYELMLELNREFVRRYKKQEDHMTIRKLADVLATPPKNLADVGWIVPPKCMPEQFRKHTVVDAYRAYYRECKAEIAHWTDTPIPYWFQ